MDKYSYIGNADVAHINNLYESYQEDPESVDASWRLFFQGFEFSANSYGASAERYGKLKRNGGQKSDTCLQIKSALEIRHQPCTG